MRWGRRRSMSCSEVLVVLQSYLDGETDASVARGVIRHLRACPPCEHEQRLYLDIKVSLIGQRHQIDPEVMAALTSFGQRLAKGELS